MRSETANDIGRHVVDVLRSRARPPEGTTSPTETGSRCLRRFDCRAQVVPDRELVGVHQSLARACDGHRCGETFSRGGSSATPCHSTAAAVAQPFEVGPASDGEGEIGKSRDDRLIELEDDRPYIGGDVLSKMRLEHRYGVAVGTVGRVRLDELVDHRGKLTVIYDDGGVQPWFVGFRAHGIALDVPMAATP